MGWLGIRGWRWVCLGIRGGGDGSVGLGSGVAMVGRDRGGDGLV